MVSSFLITSTTSAFLSDIINSYLPMFFLSQISLCKSLQHEQRTDERRKLISTTAHSLSCIHKVDVTCTPSYERIQVEYLFRLHRSFSYLLSSTATSSCVFLLLHTLHNLLVTSCLELTKVPIKTEQLRRLFAAEVSLALVTGFLQDNICYPLHRSSD